MSSSSNPFNSSGSSAAATRPSIFNQPESSSHAESQSRGKHSYSYEPRPVFSHIVEPRPRCASEADPEGAIPATEFDPPERITAMILSDLSRDDTSLGSIAFSAGTTVEALTLWMSRPDIAHRLAALEAGLAQRVRVVCANYSAAVLSSCGRIIKEYNEAESAFNSSMSSFESRVVSCRNRATVIKAGKLLLRFNAAYTPAASRPCPPTSPALAGEVVRGSARTGGGTCDSDHTPAPDLRSLRASRFPAPSTQPPAHESAEPTAPAHSPRPLETKPPDFSTDVPESPAGSAPIAPHALTHETAEAPSTSASAHKYPSGPALAHDPLPDSLANSPAVLPASPSDVSPPTAAPVYSADIPANTRPPPR